jgi:death-on-curing protein
MRYLTPEEVLALHDRSLALFGGRAGIRDAGLFQSAVAQPTMTFGGGELYPTIEVKAAALGFSLIKNHAFIDGNKRVGFASVDVFLRVNRYRIVATTDDAEAIVIRVAISAATRDEFAVWIQNHMAPVSV